MESENILASGYATPRASRALVIAVGVIGVFVTLVGVVAAAKGKLGWTTAGVGVGLFAASFGLYLLARVRFVLVRTGAGPKLRVGSTTYGPSCRWQPAVCTGVTRTPRRAVANHPVLQLVVFDGDQPVVRFTEIRNVFKPAPHGWPRGEPIKARSHYGNIVGNIGLEELVRAYELEVSADAPAMS